jgi:hypothetical protein
MISYLKEWEPNVKQKYNKTKIKLFDLRVKLKKIIYFTKGIKKSKGKR